jgi:hypothetical protein
MALEYLREYRTYFHLAKAMDLVKALAIEIVDGSKTF